MCKISVIIPMYNSAACMGRAIDSVLANTLRKYELLLIDDGSTDETAERAASYCEKDTRVRLVRLPKNRGVAAARNCGLDESKGEYIAFVDADDYVSPDYLQALYDQASARELDWVACNSRIVHRYPGKKERLEDCVPGFSSKTTLIEEDATAPVRSVLLDGEKEALQSNACGLYSRAFLEQHQLRLQEGVTYGEDVLFNYQVCNRLRRFGYLSEALYTIVKGPDSGTVRTSASDFSEKVLSLLRALDATRADEGEEWDEDLVRFAYTRIRLLFALEEETLSTRRHRRETYRILDDYLRRENRELLERIGSLAPPNRGDRAIIFLLRRRAYEGIRLIMKRYNRRKQKKEKQDEK